MLTQYKIVCIGDSGVGKTSIIRRCTDQKFRESVQLTLGLDFLSLKYEVNSQIVRLHIWDTAGQQRFSSLNRNYFQNSQAAVIVVQAVDSIPDIWKQVQKYGEEYVNLCQNKNIYLIFNKIDLVDFAQFRKKVVQQKQKISQLQRRYSIKNICFLSAKTSTSKDINSLFQIITSHIVKAKNQAKSVQIPPRSFVLGSADKKELTKAKNKSENKKCCF